MKIINHSGDTVRQIVPQDMSFLSDADQQIVEAFGNILGMMFGLSGDSALVMQGMDRTFVPPSGDRMGSLSFTGGVVMHNGKLYSFAGGEVGGMGGLPESYGSQFCLKFTENDTVAPSPVYGANIETTVSVHKERRAVLVATPSEPTSNYVVLKNVRVISQLASTKAITASLYYVDETNTQGQ